MERPINRVKPRICVPDTTTPANSGEGQNSLVVDQVVDVDVERVTSDDSDGSGGGWLEQSTSTPT